MLATLASCLVLKVNKTLKVQKKKNQSRNPRRLKSVLKIINFYALNPVSLLANWLSISGEDEQWLYEYTLKHSLRNPVQEDGGVFDISKDG